MSDEEDYNSEEDADYVPSEGDVQSEEENSGEEEDLSVLADEAETTIKKKKTRQKNQNKKDIELRKRGGGIRLECDGDAEKGETNGGRADTELAEKLQEEATELRAEKEKKRTDDLWASFLLDVKPQPKPSPKTPQTSTTIKPLGDCDGDKKSGPIQNTKANSGKTGGGTVTITQVFDFAGEEIKVTKEVDVNSKEAKAELKKQQDTDQQIPTTAPSSTSATSSTTSLSADDASLGLKRPATGSGLGNVLNKISKKPKMGTLEKSKMDWDSFKKKEGINEDLKIHNKGKDGYIERMAFLNRTDIRQFELERDLRQSKSGKR